MNNKINPEIIEKIQKLLRLGQSPNENESKLAIENANKLLIKYNLSMESVEEHEEKDRPRIEDIEENVVDQAGSVVQWKLDLLNILADHNFCSVILGFNKNQVMQRYDRTYIVVGKPCNSITTKVMYNYLIQVAERLSEENYNKKQEAYPSKYVQKNSWKLGFTVGIRERLEKLKKEEIKINDEVVCTALMVKNLDEKEKGLVKAYINENYGKDLKNYRSSTQNWDSSSYYQGKEQANKVNLNNQIN